MPVRAALLIFALLCSRCAGLIIPRPYGEQVDLLLQQHESEFRQCFKDGPPAPGSELHFRVDTQGHVTQSSVPGASTENQECVGRVVRSIVFPTREGNGFLSLVYPLTRR
ncbi:MAG: hypothetical protein ACXVBW_11525 [Bdellovibrionota bacterium]